jgi:hypothetical protein
MLARRRKPQSGPCQSDELACLTLTLSRPAPVLQSVSHKKIPQMCCCPMSSSPDNVHHCKGAGNGESVPCTGHVHFGCKAMIGAT